MLLSVTFIIFHVGHATLRGFPLKEMKNDESYLGSEL